MSQPLLTRPARRIPSAKVSCDRCGRPIVWAITVAGPNGPGGKAQPFDPYEAVDVGNVALYPGHHGRIFARALFKDEQVDRPLEYAGMPHAATCPGDRESPARRLPDDVADLHAARARRQR